MLIFLNYVFIVSSQGINEILEICQPNLCLFLWYMIKLPKAMLCTQVRICYYTKSLGLFCIRTDNNSPYEVCNFSKSSCAKYILIFKEQHFPSSHLKWLVKKSASSRDLCAISHLGFLRTEQLQIFHPEQPEDQGIWTRWLQRFLPT